MSNLLKKGSTITKSERVIDYNEKIKEKLQAVIDAESAAGDQSSDGFVNGLTADVVERLTQDDDANEETSATQEELENHINELREEAESIIADVPSYMAFATSVASALVGRGFFIMESSICVAVMTCFSEL